LKFLIQAKRLPPTLQLMARLLGCLFVRAEIKDKKGIVHTASLQRSRRQVKARRASI
jgi:hypothetical protein